MTGKFNQGNTKASKLTGVQVIEIREKYASGMYTQVALSREYKVSIGTIRNVVYGVTWQHLAGAVPEEQVELQAKQSEKLFLEALALSIPATAPVVNEVDAVDEYMKRRGSNEQTKETNEERHSAGGTTAAVPEAQETSQNGEKVAGE